MCAFGLNSVLATIEQTSCITLSKSFANPSACLLTCGIAYAKLCPLEKDQAMVRQKRIDIRAKPVIAWLADALDY